MSSFCTTYQSALGLSLRLEFLWHCTGTTGTCLDDGFAAICCWRALIEPHFEPSDWWLDGAFPSGAARCVYDATPYRLGCHYQPGIAPLGSCGCLLRCPAGTTGWQLEVGYAYHPIAVGQADTKYRSIIEARILRRLKSPSSSRGRSPSQVKLCLRNLGHRNLMSATWSSDSVTRASQ